MVETILDYTAGPEGVGWEQGLREKKRKEKGGQGTGSRKPSSVASSIWALTWTRTLKHRLTTHSYSHTLTDAH